MGGVPRYTAVMPARSRIAFLVICIALSACTTDVAPPLPSGVQSATGAVRRVELSLVRRGTHMLVVDGKPLYFLESRSVDLRPFEETTVGVHGTLARNTDADDLPVLVVEGVTAAAVPSGAAVAFPALRMTLVMPQTWQKQAEGARTVFSASGAQTVLRIGPSPLASLPEDGVLLLLGGRKAARTFSSTGVEELTVDAFGTLVLLELPPFASADRALITERAGVLQSIAFVGTASSSVASPSSQTSSQGANYCGGAAGILCPRGSICIITDAAANVGYCKVPAKPEAGVR